MFEPKVHRVSPGFDSRLELRPIPRRAHQFGFFPDALHSAISTINTFIVSVRLTPHRRKAALHRQYQANPGHKKGSEYSPIPQECGPVTVQCTAADSLAERRAEWDTGRHR